MRLFKSQDLIWMLGERRIKLFLVSRGIDLWWDKEVQIFNQDGDLLEIEILVGTQDDIDIFRKEIMKAFGIYAHVSSSIFTGGSEEVKPERPMNIDVRYIQDCLGGMVTLLFNKDLLPNFLKVIDNLRAKGYKTFWKYKDNTQIIA